MSTRGDTVEMHITGPDGTSVGPFNAEDLHRLGNRIRAETGPRLKETPEDVAVRDRAYAVTASELRQFIERFERLDEERREVVDQQKEVMAEAKGRGYDTRVLRKIIARRKRSPDDVAEEEAVLQLYLDALEGS